MEDQPRMIDFTVTVTPGIIDDSTVKVIGLDLAREAFAKQVEAIRKAFQPTLDAMKMISDLECATSLRKRRSHRHYCQVRAESIYGLKPTLAEVAAQWVKRTTDIQDPIDQLQSSSLHCHGPPSRLVSKLSHFPLTHTCGLRNGEPQR